MKIGNILLSLIIISFVLPFPVLAASQEECEAQCAGLPDYDRCVTDCLRSPIGIREDIQRVLNNILTWVYTIAGIIAVLMIIIGGIMYMTAGGNEEKVGKAKNLLKYAIIGLVVALIAYGVRTIILSFMP